MHTAMDYEGNMGYGEAQARMTEQGFTCLHTRGKPGDVLIATYRKDPGDEAYLCDTYALLVLVFGRAFIVYTTHYDKLAAYILTYAPLFLLVQEGNSASLFATQ